MTDHCNNPQTFDAVELEVFKHLLAAVAEEMGVRLMRSAYSSNIKERRDFSCAVFDAHGDMIAQAAHIPVHLGSAPASVKAVLAAFDPATMRQGDRFIVNDPFAGGTHLPDVTLVAPVMAREDDAGPPIAFVANRAHHADVGGITAGSLPLSRTIDEEGVRIPPSRLDAALVDDFCRQVRTPAERRGDLLAQQASLDVGIARLRDLMTEHRSARVVAAGAALQAYTARQIRALIAGLPDGQYAFTDHLDDDGFGRRDVAIRVTLTIDGERATVDLRDSDDQTPGPVNAVRAIALSAVMYVFRCLGPSDLPSNSGVLEPVEVLTRPGSVVDAQPPAAVAAGNVETSQRLVDAVFGALAQAAPDRVPAASCGSMNNLTMGGTDAEGQPFAYYETLAGGAGASPAGPGASAIHTHMTNTLNTPVEALEHSFPLRIEQYAVRTGSGGRGRHPGGDGLVRTYRFLTPATVTLLTERRSRGPWGLAGGQPGAPGINTLTLPGRDPELLPAKVSRDVPAGATLTLATPAGGGWGFP